MPRKPAAPTAQPMFDLTKLPGSPADQRRAATDILIRGAKPIAIEKASNGYRLKVLGVDIGTAPDKGTACSAAHQVGRYRLQLGDFASTYVDGYCKR